VKTQIVTYELLLLIDIAQQYIPPPPAWGRGSMHMI
jgi:hypothetical protein